MILHFVIVGKKLKSFEISLSLYWLCMCYLRTPCKLHQSCSVVLQKCLVDVECCFGVVKDVVPVNVVSCERQLTDVDEMLQEMRRGEDKHRQMKDTLKQVCVIVIVHVRTTRSSWDLFSNPSHTLVHDARCTMHGARCTVHNARQSCIIPLGRRHRPTSFPPQVPWTNFQGAAGW